MISGWREGTFLPRYCTLSLSSSISPQSIQRLFSWGGQQLTSHSSSSMLQGRASGTGIRWAKVGAAEKQGKAEQGEASAWVMFTVLDGSTTLSSVQDMSTLQKCSPPFLMTAFTLPTLQYSPARTFRTRTSSPTCSTRITLRWTCSGSSSRRWYALTASLSACRSLTATMLSRCGSGSWKEESSGRRQRAQRRVDPAADWRWMQRRQKAWPQVRVVGASRCYRQIMQRSSSSCRHYPIRRTEIFLFGLWVRANLSFLNLLRMIERTPVHERDQSLGLLLELFLVGLLRVEGLSSTFLDLSYLILIYLWLQIIYAHHFLRSKRQQDHSNSMLPLDRPLLSNYLILPSLSAISASRRAVRVRLREQRSKQVQKRTPKAKLSVSSASLTNSFCWRSS